MFAIPFPGIDPVAIQIGPLAIRWYALAYVAGILLGWRYAIWLTRRLGHVARDQLDDLVVWATLGIIIGGRLGYVAFYKPRYFLENPGEIVAVWQGGMSFHGGLLGVAVALLLFAKRRRIALLPLADLIACAAPIGLFFGRLANFINGELYGRPSNVPWAIVFPNGGPFTRHPSQLYEALLEGPVLLFILYIATQRPEVRARPGVLAGVFLMGYATARSIAEVFRAPDAFIGFLPGGVTMGQALSAPLLLFGALLIVFASRADE
jgi:phosphatidylglycerol:prolipoprotein diacylglycerol transferase